MSNTYYFDFEPFAERIAQVITGDLTEAEFKTTFPEIEYRKVGETENKKTVTSVEKFMVRNRTVYQVARTGDSSLAIFKIAQFGDAPTPEEEFKGLSLKKNILIQRMSEYQAPGVVLVNPETFEPFDDSTEEGRAEKNEYIGRIADQIRELDTQITAAKALIK